MKKKDMTRPGVLFYFETCDPLMSLGDREVGKLFKAAMTYGRTGALPEFEGMLDVIWGFLQPRIDADRDRYDGIVQQKKYASYCARQKRKGLTALCFEDWAEDAEEVPSVTDDASRDQPAPHDADQPPMAPNESQPEMPEAVTDAPMTPDDTEWYPNTNANTKTKTNTNTNSISISNSDSESNTDSETAAAVTPTRTVTRESMTGTAMPSALPQFSPPSVQDIRLFCLQQGFWIDAEEFLNHFAGIGWKIGKSEIRDWRAAVKLWVLEQQKNRFRPSRDAG